MQESHKNIRIAVCDDHDAVLDAVTGWLSETPGMRIVGAAKTMAEMLEVCKKSAPDVAVVDLIFKGEEMPEVSSQIKAVSPQAAVLVYSGFTQPRQILDSLNAGASGYVSKEMNELVLIEAIEAVAKGGCFFDSSIAKLIGFSGLDNNEISSESYESLISSLNRKLISDEFNQKLSLLTERQREVLHIWCESIIKNDSRYNVNALAAEKLGISSDDLKTRIWQIRKALKLTNEEIIEMFKFLHYGTDI